MLVFPALEDFEIFQDSALQALDEKGEALAPDWQPDLGNGVLSLVFDPQDRVSAERRREQEEHGWELAGPDAYPRVEQRGPEGDCLPLEARDLRIAEACALALASFTARHGQVLQADDPEPVCESYYDCEDLEVRLTFPYEAHADFDITSGPPAGRTPSATSRKRAATTRAPAGAAASTRSAACPGTQPRPRAGRARSPEHHTPRAARGSGGRQRG